MPNKSKDFYIENSTKILISSVELFNNDYSKTKKVEIKLESCIYGTNVVTPMHINNIINSLNIYVKEKNDIEDLNEGLFQHEFHNNIINDNQILKIINSLSFKFFSNDKSRVGKDNSYWYEIEIGNLPNNKYLTLVFIEILSKFNIVDSIVIKDLIYLLPTIITMLILLQMVEKKWISMS